MGTHIQLRAEAGLKAHIVKHSINVVYLTNTWHIAVRLQTWSQIFILSKYLEALSHTSNVSQEILRDFFILCVFRCTF